MGVIGLGNMGLHHAGYLAEGEVRRARLIAVADAIPARLELFKTMRTFEGART